MSTIPNIITLINLFLGCMAVSAAFLGQPTTAAGLIIICAILDFLDGTAARLLKAGSDMGKQLDSLADLISFGLAPAAIMYHYLSTSPHPTTMGAWLVSHIPYLAFLLTVCSAIRLARFNTDTRQTSTFIGLPTPANAMFFATIPLVIGYSGKQGQVYATLIDLTASIPKMSILILLFSWLLISPIRMFSLKFNSLGIKKNTTRYLFLLLTIMLFLFVGWESMPLIMLLYISTSIIAENLVPTK